MHLLLLPLTTAVYCDALPSSLCCVSAYRGMFYQAPVFDQSLCWDMSSVSVINAMFAGSLGSLASYPGCLQPSSAPSPVPTPVPTAIPTLVPTPVPTFVPTYENGATAALMALIEAMQLHVSDLQLHVSDLQSTVATINTVNSDLVSTIVVMQATDADLQSVDSAMAKDMSDIMLRVDRLAEWKRKVRRGTENLTTRRTPRMKISDDDTDDTLNLRRN